MATPWLRAGVSVSRLYQNLGNRALMGRQALPLELFQRLPEREQRLLEWWQIVFDCFPDNRGVNALIVVPQNVAYSGDIFPAHVLVLGFQVTAEMPAGFRNNLDAALDRRAQQP